MQISVEPKRTKYVEPGIHLQQTAFWGRLKKQQGRQARAFDIALKDLPTENLPVGETLHGPAHWENTHASRDMLVVIRSLGAEGSMAYVPFGPELLPDADRRGRWLEQLSERIRPHLPANCVFIRYDLPWESPWAADKRRYTENDIWMGKPRTGIREMRMNFDTKRWNLRKAPTDLLPTDTVILDLTTDRDRLLRQMKPKTRYNIRLSSRKGVRVREAGIQDLSAWYDIYCQTADRHGMMLNSLDYFKAALEVNASDSGSPASIHLLLAEVAEKPVAGILLAIAGSRATYLYGASSLRKSHCMPAYALQWTAICKAKAAGCHDYDLFGTAPYPDPYHPMYGLYRFKTGFGGQLIHRQGCWDYPYDESRYDLYRAQEMAGPAFVS
ncbi:MAG TPA: peptidoglycan bridge formation glycyltransferase FemA/FemB family protein [Desulfosalsimonadaceae bacterium]|nr:peptidoglycan bridge formation glycyltransferase FemA/FemB family protein [Desulfosalsimonadaceae bacterium]